VTTPADPHAGQPVLRTGAAPGTPAVAVVALHGRGAGAEDMLALALEVDRPHVSWLAPQARHDTWYPNRFLAPLAENEPWLGSALALVGRVLGELAAHDVPASRTILLGFSQGACLALEYAARNARRFGGVAGLSGGLIGPPGTRWGATGSFDGTPVFLGCSDDDPHIPLARVRETATVLTRMGAAVTERIYPAAGHTVLDDEIRQVRAMIDAVASA
jgi:predicted esterase